jgi:hypothetical protein
MTFFTAIQGKFSEGSGGIGDADISTGAGINADKLSTIPGKRVKSDRIEDDAVGTTQLRDDPTVDANRAVTTAHIRDAAVTTPKLADASVTYPKKKTSTFEWTPGGVFAPLATNSITTGSTVAQKIPAAIYLRRNGGILAPHAVATYGIYENTGTGTYFVYLGNPTAVNQDFSGLTVHVEFEDKT